MGNSAATRAKKYQRGPAPRRSNATGESSDESLPTIAWEGRPLSDDHDKHNGGASVAGRCINGNRRASARARDGLAQRRHAADVAIRAIREQEAVERNRLWDLFDNELTARFTEWDRLLPTDVSKRQTVMQIRAVLRAAVTVGDSAQLGVAMLRAESLGMPLRKNDALRNALDRLLAQEDRDGVWRCLATGLADDDDLAVDIWMEEAKCKGLAVPTEVKKFLQKKRSQMDELTTDSERLASHHTSSEQEYVDTHALEAYDNRDSEALRQLLAHAKRAGCDTSLCEALLIALDAERWEACDDAEEKQPQRARPKSRMSAFASSEKTSRAEAQIDTEEERLLELRRLGPRALKEELSKLGVDSRGACEKEELVRLLHDARRSAGDAERRKQRRNTSDRTSGAGSPTQSASAPRNAGSSSSGGASRSSRTSSPTKPAPTPPPPTKMTRAEALNYLGLDERSTKLTAEDLRRAYKAGALKWHPDRQCNHGKEEDATKRFQDVRAAYEYLRASV
eukprot:TRINITY_DN76117_c0_g1_i1.p1 TRINITY_DN76117_c0_g1~~TRINITY_DN76117_c0_g1_i1.p1  ORF type:complete len:509 (+),score=77.54 TRINITY_DN76117_c0_g1_i1:323-1849(+)